MDKIIEKIKISFPVTFSELDLFLKKSNLDITESKGNDLFWIGHIFAFFNDADIDFPVGSLDPEIIIQDIYETISIYEESSTHYS